MLRIQFIFICIVLHEIMMKIVLIVLILKNKFLILTTNNLLEILKNLRQNLVI